MDVWYIFVSGEELMDIITWPIRSSSLNVDGYKYVYIYLGGISQDVKKLKIWDFNPVFFGFS